ncbi:MAG: alkaline shock response membrane anchor protein AmaP [Clostridia bacterium]|nr:alkaline shock response membrane anchor protein AmaP [Clostridia bacterium]
MKTIDRVVLVISVAVMAFLSVVILASGSGGSFPNDFAIAFYDALTSNRVITVLASILVVLVMLYVVMLALKSDRGERDIVVSTDLGEVRVSMAAIETIARRTARQVRGIRDVEATADGDNEGIRVFSRVQVYPDVSITEVCEQLEKQLADAINAAVGVPVRSVHTVVRGVASDHNRPRV